MAHWVYLHFARFVVSIAGGATTGLQGQAQLTTEIDVQRKARLYFLASDKTAWIPRERDAPVAGNSSMCMCCWAVYSC